MIKRIFFTVIVILLFCLPALTNAKEINIAIRDFHSFTSNAYYHYLSKTIPEEVAFDLMKIDGVNILNNKELDEKTRLILPDNNKKFSSDQLLEIQRASKPAQLVILGTYSINDGNEIILTLHFLDAERISVVETVELKGNDPQLLKLVDEVVYKTIEVMNRKLVSRTNIKVTPELKAKIDEDQNVNYHAYKAYKGVNKNLSAQDYERAILTCERAISIDPNFLKPYETIAQIHEYLKQYPQAFYYYQQYLTKNLENLDQETLINVYFKMAQYLDIFGEFDDSLGYYEVALEYEKQFNDPYSLGNKHFYVGVAKYKVEEYNAAIDNLKLAVDIFSNANLDGNLARAYQGLGYVYIKTGDYDKAKDNFEKALVIYEQLDNRYYTAKIYNMMGLIYSFKKDYNKALTFFGMSTVYWKGIGSNRDLSNNYLNMGLVQEKLNNYKSASQYYKQGLEASQIIGDIPKVQLFQHNISRVSLKENANVGTEAYSYQDLNDETYRLQKYSILYNNLGLIFQAQKKYDKAFEYFTKSLNINEKLNHSEFLEANYNNLGLVYFYKGDFKYAFLYLVKALKLGEDLGDKSKVAKHYHNIGAIYYKREEYEKALFAFNTALGIRENIGDQLGVASTSFNLSLLHIKMGNNDKAIQYIKQAINIEKVYGGPRYQSSMKLLEQLN